MAERNNTRQNNRLQPLDLNQAHLQPQATDMERAVLGAILIDNRAYGTVCELLIPESFYEPRHQKIYSAIRDLSLAENRTACTEWSTGRDWWSWLHYRAVK